MMHGRRNAFPKSDDSMPPGGEDPRRFGLYLSLAQAGMEMVAPLGLGLFLDRVLGWTPWLTVGGAIGGFIGGLTHMIILAKRLNENAEREMRSDSANRKPK